MKVLISGYYGFGNFGDELILTMLIQQLKNWGLKNSDITVLSIDPQTTGEDNDVNCINSHNMKLIMERLPNFDVMISGGGSLLQNTTSIASLMYYCGLITTFTSMKKNVAIYAQGIGPIKGLFGTWLTKSTLKRCKYISVRDEKSQNLLKKWKIDSDLVCDPVLGLELPARKKTNKIGIQIRKFDTLTDKLIDDIIVELFKRYGDREYELISFQDIEDEEISKIVISKMKMHNKDVRVNLVSGLSVPQIIKQVGTYDTFIAMRYHACMLGIKYGIKTMAINYDPKVEILANAANIPCLQMKSKDNNYEKAFDALDALTPFNLLNWANSQKFDWDKTHIHELINPELAKEEESKNDKKNDKKKDKKKKDKGLEEIVIEETLD